MAHNGSGCPTARSAVCGGWGWLGWAAVVIGRGGRLFAESSSELDEERPGHSKVVYVFGLRGSIESREETKRSGAEARSYYGIENSLIE